MVIRLFALLGPLAVGLAAVAAPALRPIDAVVTDTPPEIDGRIDDAAWAKVPWQNDFTLLRQPSRRPRQATRFKVMADRQYLYFAVEALEEQPAKLKMDATEHDGKVYQDDCLEFFLAAAPQSGEYFYIAVNPRGTLLDMHVIQNGHLKIADFNFLDIQCKTAVASDRWTAELAVPWHELDLHDCHGRLGFNLARERYAVSEELSAFQPVTHDLHRMENLGPLAVRGVDFSPYRWELKPLYNLRTAADKNGAVFLHGSAYPVNHTGKMQFAKLHVSLDGGEEVTRTVMLDAGQGREIDFAAPVARIGGKQPLRLLLTERRSGKKLGSRQEMCSTDYTPLRLVLAEPHYRATFFAFDAVEKIAGCVTLNLPPEQIPETLELTLYDSRKQVIARKSVPGSGTMPFELPFRNAREGQYRLEAAAGRFHASQTITVLPERRGTVSLSRHRSVLLDGKPFVPIGWISLEPHGYRTARENHWNVTLDYRFGAWSDTQRQNFLDELHQNGLKAVVYCYPDSRMHSAERWRQPLSAEEAEAIGDFVGRWGKHPALLGWYLSDEPEGAGALPARLEAVAEVCRRADPYHPTILLNCTVSGIIKYAGISDISMPDPYPGFLAGGNAAKDMDSVTSYMKAAGQGKGAEQVLWCTPQAFSWQDFGRGGQRAPTFDEIRNMHYQSVLSGASGWLYYSWYWGAQFHPVIDYAVRYLAHEVQILEQLHREPGKLNSLPGLPRGVLGGSCLLDSGQWTILVNTATEPRAVRLAGNKPRYHCLGDRRQLQSRDGRLEFTLEKYQTVIFCDRELAPGAARLQMADFRQAAEREQRNRRKKGNLLLPEKRCRFTVTKNGRGPYAHELYLNNGDVHVPGFQPLKRSDVIVISWETPQKVSSVKIYGNDQLKIAVTAPENGGRRLLGRLDGSLRAEFPAMLTDKVVLEIEVPEHVPLAEALIHEIEIY